MSLINNFKKNKNFDKAIYYFILSLWLSLWLSIGSNFYQLDNLNYIAFISILRIALVSSLIIISFIIIFFIKKKFNKLLYLIYFYLFLQIIGLLQTDGNNSNINNWYLIFLAAGTLNVLIITNSVQKTYFNQLLLISCVITGFYCLIIIIPKIIEIYNHLKTSPIISLYGYIDINEVNFMGIGLPRVTGLARLLAIFNLFLILKLNFNNKLKTSLLLLLITVITFLIWSIQSRAVIICFYTCAILIIIFFNKFSNFNKFLFFLLILILPITMLNNFNQFIYMNNLEQKSATIETIETIETIKKMEIETHRIIKFTTSGRIDLWMEALNYYELKKFFGYGAQADRFLLTKARDDLKIKGGYGTNISNTILYAFLSGGYLAIIIFIYIYAKTINFIYLFFSKKKNYIKINTSIKLAIIILVFFFIRSLIENSFALFSVDFLLFINSVLIIEKYYKKN
jgi:O-antigen ligase